MTEKKTATRKKKTSTKVTVSESFGIAKRQELRRKGKFQRKLKDRK